MPTCYFIITNKIVKKLVNAYNLDGLDDYLINTIMLKDVCKSYELFEMDETERSCPISYNEKLYHILSYATYTINLVVLEHFSDKINVGFSPDGNAYNLIDLAVENYVEKYTDTNLHTNTYKVLILIIESELKNHKTVNLDFATRRLVTFCNEYNNYKLLAILVRKYNASMSDVYHYSIVWGYQKVFDNITNDFYDVINFEWTKSAINIALRFKEIDMVCYVINKMNTLHPESYEKLKYLLT